MNINKYKELTNQVCVKKGWDKEPIHDLWMYLIEEIGELAGAIRRSQNKFTDKKKVNVESEIMDVLSYLFQIAYIYNVDLDSAIKQIQLKNNNICYINKQDE